MCLAIPGKITKIEGKKVTVQYPHEERTAFLGDDGFAVGDYVLVQMGIAMKKISEEEALKGQAAWNKVT